MDIVESIDKATNGQEAVEFIKKNEMKAQKRYYDLIFLDLDMPILNGYETCEQTVKFYKAQSADKIINDLGIFDDKSKERPSQSFKWLEDLKAVYKDYLHMLEKCKTICSIPVQGQQNNKSREEIESEQLLSIFKALYEKVKYNAL